MSRKPPPLQLPVITGGFAPAPAYRGWGTGIRCPRCCAREIVYNGNYYCSGFGEVLGDERDSECRWALPDDEDPKHVHYRDLEAALVRSQTRRIADDRRFHAGPPKR